MRVPAVLVFLGCVGLLSPVLSQFVTLDGYIIKLKANADPATITTLANNFNTLQAQSAGTQPQPVSPYAVVTKQYQRKVFNGIAGRFSKEFITYLKAQSNSPIEYIEKDGIMDTSATYKLYQVNTGNWGLRRLAQWTYTSTRPYYVSEPAGRGVTVYILDTGVMISHPEFRGHASYAANYVPGEGPEDTRGHGTHVAGIVGGSLVGAARNATIRSVKVIGANGGQFSWVVSGIQYVIQNAVKGKTVINMSLGGALSQSVNDAITAAYNAGIPVIVAAGNSADDACNYSPAGAGAAVFAVGGVDNTDKIASWSNYGSCVDVFAPGVGIYSTWNNGSYSLLSGTSMASPHAAGTAALYLSMYSLTVDQLYYYLGYSRSGMAKGVPAGTTTTVMYNGCDPQWYYW